MASVAGKVTVPVKPVPWKEGDRDVPAVLGHDEGQPAYGVAVKTWRNGPKLMADIVNVPASVAAAVKAGQYFQTSAEVYDDTGEAGLPAGGGCMLRRIALLGADIPQVKTLSDLPKPDGSGNLKGVEIFAAGTHRGINYTEGDLDKMVANFNRYSAPAVKFAAGSLRHKVSMVRKFAGGEQTGPKGGKYHVTESGAKVYDGGGSAASASTPPAPKPSVGASWKAARDKKVAENKPGYLLEQAKKSTTIGTPPVAPKQAKTQDFDPNRKPLGGKQHDEITAIAKKHLDRDTLGTQRSDSLDFKQHHVGRIHDALKAAFVAGKNTAGGANGIQSSAIKYAAKKHLGIDSLEPKNSDRDDFKDVSAEGVRSALASAHDSGRAYAQVQNNKIQASHDASVAQRNKLSSAFEKHSEVPMDRQRIIDALVAAGMDVSVASNLDDATLQALQPVADKVSPGSQPPDKMADADVEPNATQDSGAVIPPNVNDEAATDSPEFDRTAIVAQLVGKGLDPNELNALSDDDLKLRLQQVNSATGAVQANDETDGPNGMGSDGDPDDLDGIDNNSETVPGDKCDQVPGNQPDDKAPVDGQKLKKMSAKKYKEEQVTAMHAQLVAAQDQINKTVAQAARDVKKAKFEAYKEVLRAQGKLVPAMEEKGLLDQFVDHLDHSTVRKFGEGKKTQFEMFQEILGMVPRVVKFGESVKSSSNGVLKLAESLEDGEGAVRARFRKFGERYSKMGFKEDEAVLAYKNRKARNPQITASDVLPD